VRDGVERLAGVRTTQPIPRSDLAAVREALRRVSLRAPVEIGDIAARDLLHKGVDVVVTRAVARRPPP
jgi:CxxC motif-containing protein